MDLTDLTEYEYQQKERELLIHLTGYKEYFNLQEVRDQYNNLLPDLYTFLVIINRLDYDHYISLIHDGSDLNEKQYRLMPLGYTAATHYKTLQ